MKKILAIILTMLLVFFLFSCSSKNVEYDSNNGNYIGGGVGDRPLLTIESLSEYKKFIKEATLPEDFVYYDNWWYDGFLQRIYKGAYL